MANQRNRSVKATQKIKYITFLQSFGVTLVVFTHSTYIRPIPACIAGVLKWVTAFYMPLFFFIAGYLFLYTYPDKYSNNLKLFVINKIKRILIPYIILSLLAFPPKALLSNYALRKADLSITSIISGLLIPEFNPVTYFWFLPTIFLMYLLAVCLYKTIWPKTIFGFLLITLLLVVLHFFNPVSNIKILDIRSIPTYYIFFWLGSLFLIYENKLNTFLSNILILILLLTLTILLTFAADNWNSYLVRAILGIVLSLSLAKVSTMSKYNIFAPIDGYYYQIFLLSWFFITFIRIILFNKFGLNIYIVYSTMFSFGLLLPVWLAKLIVKKANYAKFAIGM